MRQCLGYLAQHTPVRLAWTDRMFGGRFKGKQPESLTRTKKRNTKVERESVGCDAVGLFEADMDALERERLGCTERWRNARKALVNADQEIVVFGKEIDALINATLRAAGFHNYRGD